MNLVINTVAIILMLLGSFFLLIGTLGLIRLPNVFSRMHATTNSDTLGLGLVLLGLIVTQGFVLASLKIILIVVFLWLANPTAAHFIARRQYEKITNVKKD
jgi:multicomponent Na+:H+ antiporter subunit G